MSRLLCIVLLLCCSVYGGQFAQDGVVADVVAVDAVARDSAASAQAAASSAVRNIVFNGAPAASTNNVAYINYQAISTNAPLYTNSVGTAGQLMYNGIHLYVCVSSNVWRRTILAAW